ncbi:Hypothetical_protein [Hexamita inflata]|uniref:Hypothetical_protein n=1 Tax=Hexamita inflata TaxID=28002 RepID=A0AA86P0Y2_9EUKA|nr:Hypothetical protein HINF_LOCUS17256 [Hexamita inflata]
MYFQLVVIIQCDAQRLKYTHYQDIINIEFWFQQEFFQEIQAQMNTQTQPSQATQNTDNTQTKGAINIQKQVAVPSRKRSKVKVTINRRSRSDIIRWIFPQTIGYAAAYSTYNMWPAMKVK